MTRAPLALLGAALLLTACAKDDGHGSAAVTDSAATATTQPLPANPEPPAPTTGPTGFARQGVDSANAAQQRRLDEINQASDQASGTAKP